MEVLWTGVSVLRPKETLNTISVWWSQHTTANWKMVFASGSSVSDTLRKRRNVEHSDKIQPKHSPGAQSAQLYVREPLISGETVRSSTNISSPFCGSHQTRFHADCSTNRILVQILIIFNDERFFWRILFVFVFMRDIIREQAPDLLFPFQSFPTFSQTFWALREKQTHVTWTEFPTIDRHRVTLICIRSLYIYIHLMLK